LFADDSELPPGCDSPSKSRQSAQAVNLYREPSETVLNSAQPNVQAAAPDVALMTVKTGAMVLLTGIGAGLTSGLLMRLLRLAQHLSFSYSMGDFLTGVRNTSGEHRIIVVSLGGVVAGLSLYLLRRTTGSSGAEVTGAIWHKQGQLEAAPTIVKSLISIVTVGMGAAIAGKPL
jgi:H+/Cl- antiporter ClcA